jgi:hypothetical protein
MKRAVLLAFLGACGGGDPCAGVKVEPAATFTCVDDLAVAGYSPAGPAVKIAGTGTFRVTIPASAAPVVVAAPGRLAAVVNPLPGMGTVSFTAEAGTYQPMLVPAPPAPRTHRALMGISMGGAGMGIALRHPERWDLIGCLGGEPGPSMVYSLALFRDFMFDGFCPGGGLCPAMQRTAWTDLHELSSDFEHLVYQAGDGVGLTLSRNTYLKTSRDIVRALGNPASYNPASAYLPPGVAAPPRDCASPVVLHGFYDARFNPDGQLPVITFCDGGDSTALGLGAFDGSLAQTNPVEVLLAVDLNGNGKRDAGEPVIAQWAEPFRDVGSDGLADRDEPGYDPVTRPDPNGDDFHPLRNPTGTEGNFVRDEGEPFDDVGIDGVAGTPQAPAGYDIGEGDGRWTVNPNVERWMRNDAPRSLAAMTAAQRAGLSLYLDAGIRDFLNSEVAADVTAGQMLALGMPLAIYDDFSGLAGGGNFDAKKVPWASLPPNLFVRYGNPDASTGDISSGDGRHVGTIPQALNRVFSAFFWIDSRWTDGDRSPPDVSEQYLGDEHFTSPTTGRDVPYAVFLPPGWKPGRKFPVVYFLHGYGQKPEDLLQATILFPMYMTGGILQKMILVFPDGRCRDGDGCEVGTFFQDSPVNPQAQMETHLYELMDIIDQRFQ